ncbi:MAG TPA: hypothetical protein VLL07_03815, partial [Pontiella sp.]|nr:hypothetical protein [Pontiella sp.]
MALLVQTTLAGVFQDTNNPVAISVVGETDVQLATSRRVDQPTLRYQLEKTDDLTNTWSVVSTYKGDGSVISLLDGAFSVSNAAASAEFETVDFSEALSGSSRTFYRMSHWWVSTPLSEYTDDIDATYVRLRSRDGLKYLYQDPATGVVSYEAGMDIMDFRSHWYIQTSRASGQYWIFNRMTGDAIRTTSGGNLAIDALGPFSFNYRWIFHEEAGFFWIENVSYSGEYLTVDPAASGDASYAVLDPGSEDQKFIIELLPRGAMMPWLTYD